MKTLKVTVTTAVELTSKQVKTIVNSVEKKHSSSEVILNQVVDPSIIAGVKLTVGAEEIDASVYTKLEKLHIQLRENI